MMLDDYRTANHILHVLKADRIPAIGLMSS